jgi:hypothetical protein
MAGEATTTLYEIGSRTTWDAEINRDHVSVRATYGFEVKICIGMFANSKEHAFPLPFTLRIKRTPKTYCTGKMQSYWPLKQVAHVEVQFKMQV